MQNTAHEPADQRCHYQEQDSPMTLREGLAEYYRKNLNVTPPADASENGARFFASHDVAHVVFGTTTRILDEAVTDLWQAWGLDISWREYMHQGLAAPEVREVFREFGIRELLRSTAMLIGYIPKVRRRTRNMTKPWQWTGFERHLDRPLGEIRREFGIEVLAVE